MGFSHHWSNDEAILPLADWRVILRLSGRLIGAFGIEAPGPIHPATLMNDAIHVTPAGGGEDFYLRRAPGRSFCKTEHAPYDKLVCAILAVVTTRCPSLVVFSDGDQDHWQPPLDWASKCLGAQLPMPPNIDS